MASHRFNVLLACLMVCCVVQGVALSDEFMLTVEQFNL